MQYDIKVYNVTISEAEMTSLVAILDESQARYTVKPTEIDNDICPLCGHERDEAGVCWDCDITLC